MFGKQVMLTQATLLQIGLDIILMSFIAAAESVQGNLFTLMPTNLVIEDLTGFNRIQAIKSATECAIECEQDSLCLKFLYMESDKLCKMGTAATGPAQKVRKRDIADCPENNGYRLFMESNLRLCLNFTLNLMAYAQAQSACGETNGHLLVVDSAPVHEFIKKFLPMGEAIWIDGEERGVNGVFYSWENKLITWALWGGSNPDGGTSNCLNMDARFDTFKFKDGGCLNTLRYVCQID